MPYLRPHPDVAQLADRAFRAGVPMKEVCRRAGVAVSTWHRWVKEGSSHVASTLDRLEAALTALIEENDG